jgi:hypothetical protein
MFRREMAPGGRLPRLLESSRDCCDHLIVAGILSGVILCYGDPGHWKILFLCLTAIAMRMLVGLIVC